MLSLANEEYDLVAVMAVCYVLCDENAGGKSRRWRGLARVGGKGRWGPVDTDHRSR